MRTRIIDAVFVAVMTLLMLTVAALTIHDCVTDKPTMAWTP